MWTQKPSIHWTFCTLFPKIHHPFEMWIDFFTDAWVWNIIHWSFWKYWLMDLYRCSKCWHISLYNLNNSPSLMALLVSYEKCVSIGKVVKLTVAFTGFYTIQSFFLESLDFIIGRRYWTLFSQAHFAHFQEHVGQIPKVWINIVCLLGHFFFQAKAAV